MKILTEIRKNFGRWELEAIVIDRTISNEIFFDDYTGVMGTKDSLEESEKEIYNILESAKQYIIDRKGLKKISLNQNNETKKYIKNSIKECNDNEIKEKPKRRLWQWNNRYNKFEEVLDAKGIEDLNLNLLRYTL